MRYSIIELESDIDMLIMDLRKLRTAKGHDYSSQVDTLANLRLFGWPYVIARCGDKVSRIASFVKNGILEVKDESIEDTLKDNINYALYALIMYRQERGEANG